MSDGEDGAQPPPVRVKEVGTTTVACRCLLPLITLGTEDESSPQNSQSLDID